MLDQNSIVNLENRNGPAETSSFRESGHKKNHPRVSMYSSKTPPGPVEEHFWYTYTNSARVDIFGGTEYFWGQDQFHLSCLPLIRSQFSRFWMVYNSFFLKKSCTVWIGVHRRWYAFAVAGDRRRVGPHLFRLGPNMSRVPSLPPSCLFIGFSWNLTKVIEKIRIKNEGGKINLVPRSAKPKLSAIDVTAIAICKTKIN